MILRCAIVVLAAWMGDGGDAPTDGTTTSAEVRRERAAPRGMDARTSVQAGSSPLDWDEEELLDSGEALQRAFDELPEGFQVSSSADAAGTLTKPQRDSLLTTLENMTGGERLVFAGRVLFGIFYSQKPVLAKRDTIAILTGVFVDSLENGGETDCEIAIMYLAICNPDAISMQDDFHELPFEIDLTDLPSDTCRFKLLQYTFLASRGLTLLLNVGDPARVNRTVVRLERARCAIGRCVALMITCRNGDSIVVLATIRRALSDPSAEVRAVGAALAGFVHRDFQQSAQEQINQALEDSERDVRKAALATIAMSSLHAPPWSRFYSRARLLDTREDLDRIRRDLSANAVSPWQNQYLLALRTLGPDGVDAIPEVVNRLSALAARKLTTVAENEHDDVEDDEVEDLEHDDFLMSLVLEGNICCTALTLAEYGPEARAALPHLSSLLKVHPESEEPETRAAIVTALVGIAPTMYSTQQSVLGEFCHDQFRGSYRDRPLFEEDENIVWRVVLRLLLDHAADVEEKRAILQGIVSRDVDYAESEAFVQSRMEAAVELASLDERARRQLVDSLHVDWLQSSLPRQQLTQAEHEELSRKEKKLEVRVKVGIAVAPTLAQWTSYRPAAIDFLLDVARHWDKERGGYYAEKNSCDALMALARIGPTDPNVTAEVAAMIEQALKEQDEDDAEMSSRVRHLTLAPIEPTDPIVGIYAMIVHAMCDARGGSRIEAGCEVLCSTRGASAALAPLLVKVIRHQRSLLNGGAASFRRQPLSAAAVRALGIVGVSSPVAIQTLVDVVTDSTPLFQYEAAQALGRMRVARPEVVVALRKALDSEYPEVRSAAARALAQIDSGGCPAQTRCVQPRRGRHLGRRWRTCRLRCQRRCR